MMKIGDFGDVRMGHAFRSRIADVPDGNVLVIQPRNILPTGTICFGGAEPLKTELASARPLARGDVLIVNRGRFAAAVFEPPDPGAWIVPSSVLVVSVTSPSVLPEYVACYLNSASGQRLFLRHCEQTTIPFIGTGNLACMRIPIPSLARQQAVVALSHSVARHASLTNRRQELMRGILNRELTMADRATKDVGSYGVEEMNQ